MNVFIFHDDITVANAKLSKFSPNELASLFVDNDNTIPYTITNFGYI